MMNSIAAFAVMSVILTVTPGPDTLLVLRGSLLGGRGAGMRIAGGAASGSFAWGVSSAVGLTAIMATSAQLFRIIQLAGAAYLVFLGLRGFRSRRAGAQHQPATAAGDERHRRQFTAGLLSNVLNPKVGLFFLAVMPQFIPHHARVVGYALAFAAVDAVIAGTWLAVVVWISDRARPVLRRPRVSAALDRATGTVLVALGVRIVAEQAV